jgi:hypothetical protein
MNVQIINTAGQATVWTVANLAPGHASNAHPYGQLAYFVDGDNLAEFLTVTQVIIDRYGIAGPGNSERMGLEPVNVSADSAQELREFHASRCLRGKTLAAFFSTLSVEPGDVGGVILQGAIVAYQMRAFASGHGGIPYFFRQTLLMTQFRDFREGVASHDIVASVLLHDKRHYAN